MKRFISWFHVPHPGLLAGQLGECLIVYYCIDNYAALPGVESMSVAAMDEGLARRADLVFVVSNNLLQNKVKLNPNVFLSPHGVDAELFEKAADKSRPVAARVKGTLHPVVGFFGVLDDKIDVDLLLYLARSRPQWSFLLVGFVRTDLSSDPAT